ncbi:MAG: hypothetical protein K0Q79_333 [Flavipsychrobacter sp.]|nr:hypothetical protein [Flavipsychrobacter sp.]
MRVVPVIWLVCAILLLSTRVGAQVSENDTIRLGATVENGITYPMILLDEVETYSTYLNAAERIRRDKLRRDIFVVYPYALTAAAVFNDINANLDQLDRRRDRRKYLKAVDKSLDRTFKEPLKNLSIDQGHVLIKLVNRQTGVNCYHIIKELKGGLSAMMWQSVGVFFNNNLKRNYDPTGDDYELETFVREMEASNAYSYQLSKQNELMKKAKGEK